MARDDKGVWSLTTAPLAPDYWDYTFMVDGVSTIDPANPLMAPNLLSTSSMVHVPGGQIWDTGNIPHGVVHRHMYHSGIVGDDRDYYVYTPPGYDAKAKTSYPVLYLLHGFSDDARGWTDVGRAHTIFDNLIAQGKAKAMLVVMPLEYGAPEVVTRGPCDPGTRQKNMDRFRDSLLTELIPAIERDYRASKDRTMRAIAGVSMGGSETLYTGLNHPERFAWIGSFSAGGVEQDFAVAFPKLEAKVNDQLRLL
jgi:enterochelin esterase family protein